MPVQSFAEFIIYLLPGFIAVELFRSKYPARKRTDFTNISWSIVYGLLISSIILKLDDLFFEIRNSQLKDIPDINLIFLLFVGGVVGGFIRIEIHKLGFVIGSRINFFRKLIPDMETIWTKLSSSKEVRWVLVF